tara:strand:- start:10 stop:402 length:393 start_codon:yes stop_codon:yes gene_type:complete
MELMFNYLLARPNKYLNILSRYYLENIRSSIDAVWFLKYLSKTGYISSDDIMDRIYYLFCLNLPNERYLAKISLLQQELFGRNNIEEYSILTIWSCANLAIINNENNKKNLIKVSILVSNNLKINVKLYF